MIGLPIQMCSAATTFSRMASTLFVVAAECSASSENRIICRDAIESGLIALITCDGSSESARHAEPDEGGRSVGGRR
jgi:hypothetical protein